MVLCQFRILKLLKLFWILAINFELSDTLSVADTELALKYVKHQDSTISNHPYLVSISYKNKFFCSGVVLDKRWVLTTSTCVWGYQNAEWLKIRTRSDSLNSGGVVYNVTQCILHPKFVFYETNHNVALLKTVRPMRYSKKLQPIGIAKRSITANETAVASGWGLHKDRKNTTIKGIHAVDVKVQDVELCQQSYLEYTKLLFCDRPADKSPCWDDEANPIVSNYQLYGLSSFVISCTGEKYPARFVLVTNLRNWIKNTMKGLTSQ